MPLANSKHFEAWSKRYKELIDSGQAVPSSDKSAVSHGAQSVTAALAAEWDLTRDGAQKRIAEIRRRFPDILAGTEKAYGHGTTLARRLGGIDNAPFSLRPSPP